MSAIRMPEPGRYHADRPGELRRRSHPLAYIGRHLPVVLEGLASELRVGPGDRVLDLGCADMPYRRFFPAGCEYVGADLPGNPGADVEIGPDGRLPLEDERFDAVLSTQVLEHVAVPATYLAEAHRVLRPGGRLLLSTHGTMTYHPDPEDLWRWTADGLRRVVADAGFAVERLEGVMGVTATGVQFVQHGLLDRLPRALHRPVAFVFQALVALADRLDTDDGRRRNALVFALVAERPGESR